MSAKRKGRRRGKAPSKGAMRRRHRKPINIAGQLAAWDRLALDFIIYPSDLVPASSGTSAAYVASIEHVRRSLLYGGIT